GTVTRCARRVPGAEPVYRRLINMALDEVSSIDKRIEQLDQVTADLLRRHEDQVQRIPEVPGLGADSAQQVIPEIGATAATFPSEKHFGSWVGGSTVGIEGEPLV